MIAPVKQGWSCPRCGRVYGPDVHDCRPCNNQVTMGQLFPARTVWEDGARRCPDCRGDQSIATYDEESGVAWRHKCGRCGGRGYVVG